MFWRSFFPDDDLTKHAADELENLFRRWKSRGQAKIDKLNASIAESPILRCLGLGVPNFMENATMQIDGQLTKVQIESPTLCGKMSPPFPFKKDNSFVLSEQELRLRDEIFKQREVVKSRSLHKLASRGGKICDFCKQEEKDTMIGCENNDCENVIHQSCFELVDTDKNLVSGWRELLDEESNDDDGVNLIFCKECSF